MSYTTILTDIGIAKLTNSQITGLPISLTEIALGDGNGALVTPTQAATALKHEVYRGQINHLYRPEDDPAQIIAELVVLPNVGGWTVREVGIFDSEGDMIAWGSHPDIYKPTLLEGTGMDFTVSIRALVGNGTNITLKIDPGVVIAVRKWVTEQVGAHNDNINAHGNMLEAHNIDLNAHNNVISNHNSDVNAHNLHELPWIDCGAATRTGDRTLTLMGNLVSNFPKGKRLRLNENDAYLCRVYGDSTYNGGKTNVTVWFDDLTRQTVIPATITKLERSRLVPQDTANGALMVGNDSIAVQDMLMASYCCGGYWSN